MPTVRWVAPSGRPKSFPVFKKIFSIGRAPGNDISLDEPSLAAFHAQIVFDGRDFQLGEVDRDGSILLNGKKKRRAKLVHNDAITLGQLEFVFSLFDEVVPADSEREGEGDHEAELRGMVTLGEFNRRLLELSDVPAQIDALLDAVLEATHARKGFVLLLEDGEAKITAARNVGQRDLPAEVRQLSDSIIQQVVATRRPIIVSDARTDTMFRSAQSVMDLKLSSVMCAPLITQGQLLGLIYLGNDDVVRLFEESTLDLLTIFAGQAALILQNALLLDQLTIDRNRIKEQLKDKQFGDIIGTSPLLLDVFRRVEKVAVTDISVLVTGESGTGKELIARELHRRSPRGEGPFVAVNCGAIPENLIESELFGHARGAFTGAVATRIGRFQQANGGTLFLDEIGELPLALQVKLLRALQERSVTKVGETKAERVDIRVVAATNRDLEEEIRAGRFREDLYYRLNVVNLHLPALRERGEDVVVIAKFLLDKYAQEFGSKVRGFSPAALTALRRYPWPGNVRQLENRLKKAVVLCDKLMIEPDDLDLRVDSLSEIKPLTIAREEFTRSYILEILERNNGNRTKTAQDLGVDPRTIFRYLERE